VGLPASKGGCSALCVCCCILLLPGAGSVRRFIASAASLMGVGLTVCGTAIAPCMLIKLPGQWVCPGYQAATLQLSTYVPHGRAHCCFRCALIVGNSPATGLCCCVTVCVFSVGRGGIAPKSAHGVAWGWRPCAAKPGTVLMIMCATVCLS
jgi:hypothetical protein